MKPHPQYRHLVGYRGQLFGPNQFDDLQALFAQPIGVEVRAFMETLADCVLYYRFEFPAASGKAKSISHFVTTNVGPEFTNSHPFPVSIIGKVERYRSMGLPADYVPLITVMKGVDADLWLNLAEADCPVLVPKGSREFGSSAKEWRLIAPSFTAFVDGLKVDLSPMKIVFKVGGTANIQPEFESWLLQAVGENWRTEVDKMMGKPTGGG